MPNIKDKSTVNLIARLFCGECKRNKTQTLVKAGYTHGYADGCGQRVIFGNSRVKGAIFAIDSVEAKKFTHDRTKAINNLYKDYEYLETAAKAGNIQAIQARTAIQRELASVTNLHSSTLHTDDIPAPTLTPDEVETYKQAAKAVLSPPKLAESG